MTRPLTDIDSGEGSQQIMLIQVLLFRALVFFAIT